MDPKNISFQDIINGIPDPIMVIDVNNYKIISSNAALNEQAGEEDLVAKGMLCYQATHRRDSPCKGVEGPCILDEVISTKKAVRATHIHFDSDTDKLFVDIIAAPIFDKSGDVIQVIESIRDITQIKKAEEAIKEHAKDLEESNRLKDLFIDIMRHDLLGPIGAIENSSDLLLEEGSAEEKEKLVSIINNSAASLIEVIEDASKYAALNESEDIKLQIFDANKLLKESMEAYGPLAKEKNITIEHKISRSCMFKASPLIKDVISNLVSNAIKHSPKNSKVILEVEIGPPCKITVKDNGPGIPDEEKERIFERFTRIKKEGVKGSGLGLAIVKRIVDLHKGSVWVEDNPEGGSVFCVTLPKESLTDN